MGKKQKGIQPDLLIQENDLVDTEKEPYNIG